jgi:hypothetical protein
MSVDAEPYSPAMLYGFAGVVPTPIAPKLMAGLKSVFRGGGA